MLTAESQKEYESKQALENPRALWYKNHQGTFTIGVTMAKPKFLITGTSSGLGRYLFEELDGAPFRRNKPGEIGYHKKQNYDCIVHCATDARNSIASSELLAYYQSHIELTNRLIQIPHRLFVFISSCAVYPEQFRLNAESDAIYLPHNQPLYGLYGMFKLLAERIVSSKAGPFLTLRCVTIVGPTSRQTNIIKVLRNDPSPLTLSADSSFNLVSMDQIKNFIKLALARNITGTFNAGSTQNATLGEIALAVDSQPKFGDYTHNVHRVNTDKIRAVSNNFNKSVLEIAKITADKFFKKGVAK